MAASGSVPCGFGYTYILMFVDFTIFYYQDSEFSILEKY